MEDRVRDDGFEATFVVSTSREQAWDWLENARPAIEGPFEVREGQWWIPAVEAPGDELEVKPHELLRVRKAVEPCKGTEIVIVMEDAETGTRITFVQSGFGPDFREHRAWLTAGWHSILADLVVFFTRGGGPRPRHATCVGTPSSRGPERSEARPGPIIRGSLTRSGPATTSCTASTPMRSS